MVAVGVDGCPDGWLAVAYEGGTFLEASLVADFDALWERYAGAETILADVPIGLRTSSSEPRPCDDLARQVLGHRGNSVFPVPVRPAVYESSYEAAKATQERLTDGSLGTQTWAICDGVRELDRLLTERAPDARGVVREAHPEVCFWALAEGEPTTFSKTGQPLAAFWERVEILEAVDADVLDALRAAADDLTSTIRDDGVQVEGASGNDDLLDAFALALTASDLTGPLRTLPPRDGPLEYSDIEYDCAYERDEEGLPMEMAYAHPT